jgi:LytR cell envelope-related transcriptional attenuator
MTDFFDDLERQLVAATPQRAARIRRTRVRRAVTAASIMVVLIAGGAGIATAVGTGDGSDPADAPAGGGVTTGTTVSDPPAITTRPTADPPARGTYVVSLLNGTTVPGLARGVAVRLQSQRFKIGNVTNAATQDRTTTTVYYRTTDCIPAATDVASALRLGNAVGEFSLQKMPREVRVIAGGQAAVVVLVGSDQNHAIGP